MIHSRIFLFQYSCRVQNCYFETLWTTVKDTWLIAVKNRGSHALNFLCFLHFTNEWRNMIPNFYNTSYGWAVQRVGSTSFSVACSSLPTQVTPL